jgi:hypothetical protein
MLLPTRGDPEDFRRETMNRARLRSAAAGALLALFLFAFLPGCGKCPEEQSGCAKCDRKFPELSGPYLGQKPPGAEAELFAPGIVSTGIFTRDIAMTPDGNEIYFGVVFGRYQFYTLMVTKLVDGKWTEPRIAPFCGKYNEMEPAISPDGKKFYFFSFRPLEGDGEPKADSDIWVMDRVGDEWSEPYNLGPPVNTERSEFFPSVTADGTLYFTRDGEERTSIIHRARPVEGGFAEPERLGPEVNAARQQYNAFIAPDESYLIYSAAGVPDQPPGEDYYISFRDAEDHWTGPINMGPKVNTPGGNEHSPFVSRDGKYFFFMAARSRFADGPPEGVRTIGELKELHAKPENGLPDIYWIDAGFIEDLRPE